MAQFMCHHLLQLTQWFCLRIPRGRAKVSFWWEPKGPQCYRVSCRWCLSVSEATLPNPAREASPPASEIVSRPLPCRTQAWPCSPPGPFSHPQECWWQKAWAEVAQRRWSARLVAHDTRAEPCTENESLQDPIQSAELPQEFHHLSAIQWDSVTFQPI